MTRPPLAVALICLVLSAGLVAGPGGTSLDETQKARYQKLCESLIAPCCWRESLAMHRSPESLQGRDEVAALILAGKSDQEILADFESRYGARVLIEPQGERSLWLYTLPALAALAGLLGAMWVLRMWLRRRAPAKGSLPLPDDSDWEW